MRVTNSKVPVVVSMWALDSGCQIPNLLNDIIPVACRFQCKVDLSFGR